MGKKLKRRLVMLESQVNEIVKHLPQLDSIVTWCNDFDSRYKLQANKSTSYEIDQLKHKLENKEHELVRERGWHNAEVNRLKEAYEASERASAKMAEQNIAMGERIERELVPKIIEQQDSIIEQQDSIRGLQNKILELEHKVVDLGGTL